MKLLSALLLVCNISVCCRYPQREHGDIKYKLANLSFKVVIICSQTGCLKCL